MGLGEGFPRQTRAGFRRAARLLALSMVAVLLLGLLAACGGDDDDGDDAGGTGSAPTVAATTAAEGGTEGDAGATPELEVAATAPATEATATDAEAEVEATEPVASPTTAAAASPTGASGDGSGADAECREVEHYLGTSCVPLEPQRIVTLDPLTVLPTLLDLGAPVVGSATVYETGRMFPEYVSEEETAEIELVGGMRAIDVEAIVALEPDLIIASGSFAAELLPQLEEIAPVAAVSYSYYNPNWRDDILLIGEIIGDEAGAQALLDDLDSRAAEVAAQVAALPEPLELSRVDMYEDTLLYYDFDCTFFGEVMHAVGVQQPEAQMSECVAETVDNTILYLSLEQINLVDGDVIVTYQQPSTDAAAQADPFAALADNPLWQSLTAVQGERVFGMGDAWGLGADVRAAHVILDDLEATLVPAVAQP